MCAFASSAKQMNSFLNYVEKNLNDDTCIYRDGGCDDIIFNIVLDLIWKVILFL